MSKYVIMYEIQGQARVRERPSDWSRPGGHDMLIRRDAISTRHLASERRRDGAMLPCVLLAVSGMMVNPVKAVVATDTGAALEEIVVTAEKREETVGRV